MRTVRVSRRLLLSLAGVGLAGGCASEADRINNLVFGAVKKDPLYLWRSAWVKDVADMKFPLGGIYPEATARMRHALLAQEEVPSARITDAVNLALDSGWHASTDPIGYEKPIENSNLKLWVTISASSATKSVVMEFIGQNA